MCACVVSNTTCFIYPKVRIFIATRSLLTQTPLNIIVSARIWGTRASPRPKFVLTQKRKPAPSSSIRKVQFNTSVIPSRLCKTFCDKNLPWENHLCEVPLLLFIWQPPGNTRNSRWVNGNMESLDVSTTSACAFSLGSYRATPTARRPSHWATTVCYVAWRFSCRS